MHLALLACIACIGHVTAGITARALRFQCPPLSTSLAIETVTCLKDLHPVDCAEAMSVDTVAVFVCNKYHYAGKESSMVAVCTNNGTWAYSAAICQIPDCGLSCDQSLPKQGVERGQVGEIPWSVNIYREHGGWSYRCAGTLISSTHVITTAYCVTNRCNKVRATSDFLLAARKHIFNFNSTEPNSQWRTVRSISRHEKYVVGRNATFNIALLVASSSFEINSFVMPACVDWSGQLPAPTASDVLMIAGWKNGTGNKSSLQQMVSQRYSYVMDREICNASASSSHRRYITDDKLCAATVGDKSCNAGGGAGLTLRHASQDGYRHYLVGVRSTTLYYTETAGGCVTKVGDSFTNLTQYIPWISENL